MNVANPYPFNPYAPECDEFEERAAIMEYEGGLPREEAEREAAALLGVKLEFLTLDRTGVPDPLVQDYSSLEQQRDEPEEEWVFTARALLESNVVKLPCLIEPIIPKTRFSLLLGESDIGKTWFVLNLLCAIASGANEFLGWKINARYHKAILVATEDDEESLAWRLKQMTVSQAWADNIIILIADDKSNKQILAKIEELLRTAPVDIVVFDCLGDVFDGKDSHASTDGRKWYRTFVPLSKKCHVQFVHHKGKAATGKAPHKDHSLGTQAFEAKARSVFDLCYFDGKVWLSILKVKGVRELKLYSYALDIDEKTFEVRLNGEQRLTKELEQPEHKERKPKLKDVCENLELGKLYSPPEIGVLSGLSGGTLHREIKRAVEETRKLRKAGRGKYELVPPVSSPTEPTQKLAIDSSIHPNSLSNLDGWTDEPTQKSELPRQPEQQESSKSKSPELDLCSFIKPGELLSPIELMQHCGLGVAAFERSEKREVKFGLLIPSGKGPTLTYSLPTSHKPKVGSDPTLNATDG